MPPPALTTQIGTILLTSVRRKRPSLVMAMRLPLDLDAAGAETHRRTSASIYGGRALRDFGDGFIAVLLPVYLTALGLGAFEVGVVATVALPGSAPMTLDIGFFGTRADQRHLLLAACALMTATGLLFAGADTYPAILLVALMGTINPSSGSVSVFVPSGTCVVLSGSVADGERTRMFARYSLIGALAAAVGSLAAASSDVLAGFGISLFLDALRGMFVLYALLGVAACFIYAGIPEQPRPATAKAASPLGPSRTIVYKMAALFSIDAFAGGFAVQSLIALWLFSKFGLSLAAAGLFFFWSGVLAAFSFPVAAWLARRIGLVNTMVFTHIPSSLCLILGSRQPELGDRARAAVGACGAVADGRADPLVLRHGGRDAARTSGAGEHYQRSPQPRSGFKSGHRRRILCRRLGCLAARDLRCPQDPLRLGAALDVPARQTTGRAIGRQGALR